MSTNEPPLQFVEALESLRDAQVAPGMVMREVLAPRNLAPFAAAVEVTAFDGDETSRDDSGGSATLVILYDPEQEDNWGGPFRLVGHATMRIDAEQSTDPLLAQAIWHTFIDSLDEAGAGYFALVGSVTVEITETFGGLELKGSALNADLRCSWSPQTNFLTEHLDAWANALRQNLGLEPAGVVPIGRVNA